MSLASACRSMYGGSGISPSFSNSFSSGSGASKCSRKKPSSRPSTTAWLPSASSIRPPSFGFLLTPSCTVASCAPVTRSIRISTAPPVSLRPCSRAGSTRVSLNTSKSPGRSISGSSRNMRSCREGACTSSSSMRLAERSSNGACAISSGGSSKSKSDFFKGYPANARQRTGNGTLSRSRRAGARPQKTPPLAERRPTHADMRIFRSALDAQHLAQRMHHLDQVGLCSHHRADRLVRRRRLIDHRRVLAAFDVHGGLAVLRQRDLLARRGTAHHPAGTVAAAVEAVRVALATHDVSARAHAARDDAQLALSCTDRALAGDQQRFAVMRLALHVVVVAVHRQLF